MRNTGIFVLAALTCAVAPGLTALAQEQGVEGFWKEPGGSVIHVEPCGDTLCATLVQISPAAPARVDGKNPDAALRQRTLCGLHIGEGFHIVTPTRAEGGTLYDPKSGKTYHGTLTSRGDQLDLRGYIGFSLLGRTEHWTRTPRAATCTR